MAIEPVSKHGPTITIRVRDKQSVKAIHAAAKRAGMSTNTWVATILEKASEAQK